MFLLRHSTSVANAFALDIRSGSTLTKLLIVPVEGKGFSTHTTKDGSLLGRTRGTLDAIVQSYVDELGLSTEIMDRAYAGTETKAPEVSRGLKEDASRKEEEKLPGPQETIERFSWEDGTTRGVHTTVAAEQHEGITGSLGIMHEGVTGSLGIMHEGVTGSLGIMHEGVTGSLGIMKAQGEPPASGGAQ